MTENTLKSMATEYMKIWNAQNEGVLDQYAHNDLEVNYTHFEQPYQGIADYKAMLQMTYEYFPDLSITLKKVIPNRIKNGVTIFWAYSGTHQKGNLFGVEASGKQVTVKGMTWLEIENGLVKQESGIVDNLALISQLGVLG